MLFAFVVCRRAGLGVAGFVCRAFCRLDGFDGFGWMRMDCFLGVHLLVVMDCPALRGRGDWAAPAGACWLFYVSLGLI